MLKTLWDKLNHLHFQLGDDYYHFSRKKIKELKDNFAIDCGTDYADYLFNDADLLDFYNGH